MKVTYCDLCGQPIKNEESYVMYVVKSYDNYRDTPQDYTMSQQEYMNYLKGVEKQCKEICHNCKFLIDEIFAHRMDKLTSMSEELRRMYDFPEDKDDKKKKR